VTRWAGFFQDNRRRSSIRAIGASDCPTAAGSPSVRGRGQTLDAPGTDGKVLDAEALERRTVSRIATVASMTGRRIGVARTNAPCAVARRRIHLYRRGARRGAILGDEEGPMRSPMTTPASSTARRVLSSPVGTTGIWTGEGVRSIRRHSIETLKILSAALAPVRLQGPALLVRRRHGRTTA
jgi:hypothetical protein